MKSRVKGRRKSIKQIREQQARLENAIRERYDGTSKESRQQSMNRLARVVEAGGRYVRNIAQSQSFANSVMAGDLAGARGREYSQNTYMGYNNG